ncbi:hypothetical protein NDU88_000174 [Pleurodeles waltl]|uniref:Uncharacterized protein n=1 Tax=Pleurodeles waltl TaxID=8319 RepID=A0AAV7SVU7_PLEWA|nr:hypothetical protein NDU88_000174 [Pleurodeles waltl]
MSRTEGGVTGPAGKKKQKVGRRGWGPQTRRRSGCGTNDEQEENQKKTGLPCYRRGKNPDPPEEYEATRIPSHVFSFIRTPGKK